MQQPEKLKTIDGTGSSEARFKLPNGGKAPKGAKNKDGKAPAANNQGTKRPRGAVQAARNAGIRKEDSQ